MTRRGQVEVRTDEQLVVASRDDPAAFEELFCRWSDQVLAYFYRRTGDWAVSADLMAETFAVALTKRHRYRYQAGSPAIGWLFGIARNELSHYHRSRDVEKRALNKLGLKTPTLEEGDIDRIESLVDADAARQALQTALSDLPEAERAAIELRVIDELSYLEMAERLGATEGSLRVRVHRGLRRLSVRLGSL